jgi:hypothetical protein
MEVGANIHNSSSKKNSAFQKFTKKTFCTRNMLLALSTGTNGGKNQLRLIAEYLSTDYNHKS